ncbi:hypothetical protein [Undibacterium sp. TC9W]|uniref:hypothetical protein n=1 Tax=Undibacterium sp. TC9W TaxID=3413053 RepID=UPI003BF3E0C8
MKIDEAKSTLETIGRECEATRGTLQTFVEKDDQDKLIWHAINIEEMPACHYQHSGI